MVHIACLRWSDGCCVYTEESPGSMEKRWWVTPTGGDSRESATENNRLNAFY